MITLFYVSYVLYICCIVIVSESIRLASCLLKTAILNLSLTFVTSVSVVIFLSAITAFFLYVLSSFS